MIDKFKGRWYFLSNFYACEIEHQGITYPSVEHYYVAMKFNDEQFIDGKYYTPGDLREIISKTKDPAQVKKLGRKIKLRKDWKNYKLKVMNHGVREKFKSPKLSELLISTGDMELVEGNSWHDNFYGQCDCFKCKGKGKNHLGKILMKVRSEINGTKKTGLEELLK